jgi:hypothetical protein
MFDEKKQPGSVTEVMGEDHGMTACGQDLLDAIKSGNAKAVGLALKNACELADSMPHEEGEHE